MPAEERFRDSSHLSAFSAVVTKTILARITLESPAFLHPSRFLVRLASFARGQAPFIRFKSVFEHPLANSLIHLTSRKNKTAENGA